jgi:hypothetical protein
LNLFHTGEERSVVGVAICAGMNTPVAVWAERDNESRVIWSAIAQPTNVVRLKIRTAVLACESCLRLATFVSVPLRKLRPWPPIAESQWHPTFRITLLRLFGSLRCVTVASRTPGQDRNLKDFETRNVRKSLG